MSHVDEIRAFIAIPIPSDVTDYLSKVIYVLQKKLPESPIKWVQANNVHLTLKFLGNVSRPNLQKMRNSFESVGKISPFILQINRIGAFPSIYKPQVIWIGLSSHENLLKLHRSIEEGVDQFNIERDDKPFTPHLTIARTKPGIKNEHYQRIKQELINNRDLEPISFLIDKYCIYQSVLTSSGPIYSTLETFHLQTE